MKGFVRFIAAAALTAIGATGALAQAKEWKEVRIGTEGAYPPYNNLNAKKELEGFEIDYGNALCETDTATRTSRHMDTQTLAMAQEIDFSMFALFARATFTVKIVMLMLMVMSFWSWAIIIQKHLVLRKAKGEASVFDRAFWSGEPLDELFEKIGPDPQGQSEKIFAAGMLEWRRSHKQDGGLIAGAQSRIDRAMNVAISRESELMNRGLSFLATTGSTATFIGLIRPSW